MAANPYYNASGAPATSSSGASSPMRNEFAAIAAGFALVSAALTNIYASPGAIGSKTPNTGAFSSLSVLNGVTFFKTLSLSGSFTGASASFSGPVTMGGSLVVTGALTALSVAATATVSAPAITTPNLACSSVFNIGSANLSFTTGAGAPTGLNPKGSVYMRNDGGVGSTFYVSQGSGVWNAAAAI